MVENGKPPYLADPTSDPVVIRVQGRASFQNSPALRDFFREMLRQKRSRFAVDFSGCTGMDSTFMGVLAGVALELRKLEPAGSLVAARLDERNLELVRNLGLHRLLTVDPGDCGLSFENCQTALSADQRSELENAKVVLEAHENLLSVDETNRGKFQDVVAYLRSRVGQK